MGKVSEVEVSEARRTEWGKEGRGWVHILNDWGTWAQTSMLYLNQAVTSEKFLNLPEPLFPPGDPTPLLLRWLAGLGRGTLLGQRRAGPGSVPSEGQQLARLPGGCPGSAPAAEQMGWGIILLPVLEDLSQPPPPPRSWFP